MENMNYVSQPTKHTCGPTALYNLLTYFDKHHKSLSFTKLNDYCDVRHPIGTTVDGINYSLAVIKKHVGLTIRDKILVPNLNDILSNLAKNRAIILAYRWEENNESGNHYILLINHGNDIYAINYDHTNDVYTKLTVSDINRCLKPFKYTYDTKKWVTPEDHIFPKMWAVSN